MMTKHTRRFAVGVEYRAGRRGSVSPITFRRKNVVVKIHVKDT